ncbi:hypothetical protein PDE_05609 [Penicillium oxalicum 114-2]|uniref:Uncharacterized protein n=1 Tax=Penicillium oxalicum (strain 114-2 / CGMCC 5302) TaxID=933388 RepID=S8B7F8_PENO1|nr:hypothetical protein PDE_05609 [Penicillium oxalicum 114-2]
MLQYPPTHSNTKPPADHHTTYGSIRCSREPTSPSPELETIWFNTSSSIPYGPTSEVGQPWIQDKHKPIGPKHKQIMISPHFPLNPEEVIRDLPGELQLFELVKRVARAGIDLEALGKLTVRLLYRRDGFCRRLVTELVDGGESLEKIGDALLQYYNIRDCDGLPLWVYADRY